MRTANTTYESVGAELIGWALGMLNDKERKPIERILSKSMSGRHVKDDFSFKVVWWTRKPILLKLYGYAKPKRGLNSKFLEVAFESIHGGLRDRSEILNLPAQIGRSTPVWTRIPSSLPRVNAIGSTPKCSPASGMP